MVLFRRLSLLLQAHCFVGVDGNLSLRNIDALHILRAMVFELCTARYVQKQIQQVFESQRMAFATQPDAVSPQIVHPCLQALGVPLDCALWQPLLDEVAARFCGAPEKGMEALAHCQHAPPP